MANPNIALEVGAELDEVRHQHAETKDAYKKTLDMLELLANAGGLQQECKHDAEPDFCDACAYAREKESAEARTKARAWLRECGRAAS